MSQDVCRLIHKECKKTEQTWLECELHLSTIFSYSYCSLPEGLEVQCRLSVQVCHLFRDFLGSLSRPFALHFLEVHGDPLDQGDLHNAKMKVAFILLVTIKCNYLLLLTSYQNIYSGTTQTLPRKYKNHTNDFSMFECSV